MSEKKSGCSWLKRVSLLRKSDCYLEIGVDCLSIEMNAPISARLLAVAAGSRAESVKASVTDRRLARVINWLNKARVGFFPQFLFCSFLVCVWFSLKGF